MKNLMMVFACLLQVGCNYSLSKVPMNFQTGLGEIKPGTVVGFETLNTAILKPRCLECHSNAGGNLGGVNLETYENVFAQLGDIKDSVESDRMPKNRAKLPAREREILFAWIDAGGPRNAIIKEEPQNGEPIPTPTPTPAPTEPTPIPMEPPPIEPPPVQVITYEEVNQAVLAPRCIGCHSNASGNRGGINLETYENVSSAAVKIESSIKSGSMPRPRNKPLTPEQRELILKWIANGAPRE